jgi:hypothetical protein
VPLGTITPPLLNNPRNSLICLEIRKLRSFSRAFLFTRLFSASFFFFFLGCPVDVTPVVLQDICEASSSSSSSMDSLSAAGYL